MIGKPKPVRKPKRKAKRTNARKELERKLEYEVIRPLVAWRDGSKCVCADVDGGRCKGPLQWGHYLSRHSSSWMKLTIATFVQCSAHNTLEYHGDKTMTKAVLRLLGQEWIGRITDEALAHPREKPSMEVLRARLYLYQKLLDWRPATYTHGDLVNGGYYG